MLYYAKLYGRLISASVRAQMQYRVSFVLFSLSQFLAVGIEFIGIQALFQRFGSLQGWSLPEIALLYGMANTAFALTDMFGRGFDSFDRMVKSGDFDRLLLRPLPTPFQLMAQEIVLMRIGRMACGLLAVVWAMLTLGIMLDTGRILLLLFAICGGACLFLGLFILQATLCFWTVESLEIWATVTYGGVEAAQLPMPLYPSWFRDFFTFVVPLAGLNYLPASAILPRGAAFGVPPLLACASPVIGVFFLVVCLQIWKFGERHYLSTGS